MRSSYKDILVSFEVSTSRDLRVVLATYSDYFHAIFTDGKEANQEVIEMKDKSFSPEIIKVGPSTLVIFISTIRAYLRFFSQLVSFKLQALFSCVVIS